LDDTSDEGDLKLMTLSDEDDVFSSKSDDYILEETRGSEDLGENVTTYKLKNLLMLVEQPEFRPTINIQMLNEDELVKTARKAHVRIAQIKGSNEEKEEPILIDLVDSDNESETHKEILPKSDDEDLKETRNKEEE